MTEQLPPSPAPDEPEEPMQQFEAGSLNPPDSETLPNVAERLAAWQRHTTEPGISLGRGVIHQPGQSSAQFWRGATRFIASIAAQEAQQRYNFWLGEVKKYEK